MVSWLSRLRMQPSQLILKETMQRIRGHVHYTPVKESSYLNAISGLGLYFKCELFQKTGSFKFRGATNAVLRLKEKLGSGEGGYDGCVRVVGQSSGNHAQGLSKAARSCGFIAEIIMPTDTHQLKIDAVEGYGGNVHLYHSSEIGQKQGVEEVLAKYAPNSFLIPSSNHPDIMAGQGTVTMELLEQVPDLDAIIGAVSGGGLMAGTSMAAKTLKPGIRIFAAEPQKADDCARSIAAGRAIKNDSWPDTICDSLRGNVGYLSWPVLKNHLSGVITVSEEEIIGTMRTVWERMKLLIEPGAACTVAAVLNPKFKELAGPKVKKVGVILCGGNVNLDELPWAYK